MKEVKYDLVDLFAGAGGLSNGFEQTDRFNVVAAVELNRAAQRTYIQNHNNNPNIILKSEENGESDITKIDFTKLKLNPKRTIVVGGPPCQGFSNANRQKNYLISGNNQLVKEYVRAIRDIKPIAFLMENVKTMHSSVHKFFVTRYNSHVQDDFSSLHHLDKIAKQNDPIYKSDTIDLLVSKNINIYNLIRNYSLLSDVPEPIVSNANTLSILRKIQRQFEKDGKVILKKSSEITEIQNTIRLISNYNSMDSSVLNILYNAKRLLSQLIQSSIDSDIEPLFIFSEFNRFLTRCQELKEEKIECLNLQTAIQENSEYTVQANVYSYNVVDYLKQIFEYYGYNISYEVLNSSDFGVPQKRKRFIMIGIRSNQLKISLPTKTDALTYTVKDAIKDLEDIEPQSEISNYNDQVYHQDKKYQSYPLIKYYRRNLENRNSLYNHINTKSTPLIKKRYEEIRDTNGKNFHSLSEELKSSYSDAARTQNTVYLRLKYDEPSPTVINVRKSMWQHPTKARALSIREAARLQSFQDSFVFIGRKDEQYQQVGNAVPPLLAKAIAQHLLTFLNKIY
ncbi:DNA cytosine methyltransferase [Terribacillus saccharophilus]|uniref:DNA cytosine methyltransferase n=1 Tax=Terribacillus saccharophilus TaxID=361277 RepID=UPI003D2DD6FD